MNHDIIDSIAAAIGCQQCEGPLGDSPSDDFCSDYCQAAWTAARTAPLASYSEPEDEPEHVSNLVELHHPETCIACVEGRHRHSWIESAVAAAHAFEQRQRHAAREQAPAAQQLLGQHASVGLIDEVTFQAHETANRAVGGQAFIANVGAAFDLNSVEWRPLGTVTESTFRGFAQEMRRSVESQANRPGSDAVSLSFRAVDVDTEAIRRYYFDGATPIAPAAAGSGMRVVFGPGVHLLPPELVDHLREIMEVVGRAWAEACRQIAPAVEQVARTLHEVEPDDPQERALWLRRNRNTGPAARNARAPRAINPHRRPR
ncbi:hypothetical protein PV646_28695 [Streptomyces sp. ID05-26A]|nr:hypothetical protein [Streptomyces sp. ID05-26A]